MKTFNILNIFIFFIFIPLLAQAEEDFTLFVEANQAYERQDFITAAKSYEALIQKGHINGHLYFNLGNTYYRLGNLGAAIGNYLQAQQFLPRHEDIIANLNYLRQKTLDQKEDSETSLRLILNGWTQKVSLQEWIISLVVAATLFWASALLRLFYRREVLSWLLITCGGFALFLGVTTFIKWWTPLPVGTILTKEISIYSAPHDQATVLFQLHRGTEVTINDESENWWKIQFDSAKSGWVEKYAIYPTFPNGL